MTTAIANVLTAETIRNVVGTTNSFTKLEMAANRDAIRLARAARREQLAELTGSNVGSIVDKLKSDNNATVTSMVHRHSATQQKWTIVLTAKRHASPADLLKEKAARLQKQLNKVEAALDATQKPTVTA